MKNLETVTGATPAIKKPELSIIILALFIAASVSSGLAQLAISTQPTDQFVAQGYNLALQVRVARATAPVSYAWFLNGSPLSSATANNLTITNIQPIQEGDYSAIATDAVGSVTSRVARLTVLRRAILNSKIGPNVMIGEARTNPPSASRAQAEPHLGRSLADPNLIVATFRESSSFSLINTDMGYAVSRDGGQSWSPRTLLSIANFESGTWQFARLGVVAFDAANQPALLTTVWNSGRSPAGVNLLFTSTNSGMSYSTRRFPTISGETPGHDWIAIDSFTNSPSFGRIFAVWDGQANQDQSFAGIRTTYSDDRGQTWTKPLKLTSGDSDSFPQALFLPDGSVVIVYFHGPVQGGDIYVQRSTDGGQTFADPVTAGTVIPMADSKIIDLWYYSGVLAASDQLAGVLYLAWPTLFDDGTRTDKRIVFSKSIDKGLTWTSPIAVNDTPDGRQVFRSQIAVSPDGQHVMITFYDRRHDPGQDDLFDLYLAESFDGGDTWEPNLRVSEFSSDVHKLFDADTGKVVGNYLGLVPSVGPDSPGVACWVDTRTGYPRVFTARIGRTRGPNFETWRKLRWASDALTDQTVSGPAGDPDRDNLPNLAEYALGLEPNRPDPAPLRANQLPGESSIGLKFTYPNVLSDVAFAWEESTDLSHWTVTREYPKEATPPDGVSAFWRTENWIDKLSPDRQKFVRLIVRKLSQ